MRASQGQQPSSHPEPAGSIRRSTRPLPPDVAAMVQQLQRELAGVAPDLRAAIALSANRALDDYYDSRSTLAALVVALAGARARARRAKEGGAG